MKKIESIEEFNNFDEEYILKKLTNNKEKNRKILEKYFGLFLYEYNSDNDSLLQIFAKSKSEFIDSKIFYSLLDLGVDPNHQNDLGDNFIQTAIKSKNSSALEYSIFCMLEKLKFNFNHVNKNGETIFHTFLQDFSFMVRLFTLNSDTYISKSHIRYLVNYINLTIKDKKRCTIIDLLKIIDTNNDKSAKNLKDYLLEQIENIINNNELKYKNWRFISNRSKTISKNDSITWINRKLEILELRRVFCKNKFILITGKTGSGRTTLIKKLIGELNTSSNKLNAYSFVETSIDNILTKCENISSFKFDLLQLIKKCAENNTVLLIKNFDDIFKMKLSDDDIADINLMIDLYLEKRDLTLICTSSKDKNNLIFDNNLINKIKEVYIKEPNDVKLKEIIDLIQENNFIDNENKNIYDLIYSKLLILISKEKNIIDNSISRVKVVNESIKFLKLHHINIATMKESIMNNKYITDEIKKEIEEIFEPKTINNNLESYEDLEKKVNKSLKLKKES